jgi:hypothetical protein
LGVLGGDNQGYPNGRRLADDVTDISLRAVAGSAYPLFHAGFTVDATGNQLGDGVDRNDKPFRSTFPYLALPLDGFGSIPHQAAVLPSTGDRVPNVWWFVGGGIAALAAGFLLIWRARKPQTA